MSLALCRAVVKNSPDCDSAWFAAAQYMAKLNFSREEIAMVMRRAFAVCPSQVLYRIDFALLLSRLGMNEESYRLLTAVDLSELLSMHCRPRLRGITAIFEQARDDFRARACQSRVAQITEQPWTFPNTASLPHVAAGEHAVAPLEANIADQG